MLLVSPNLNTKLLEQLSWGNWVYPLVAVFVFLIVRSIKRRYFNGLTSIPGPWLASVTRAWRIKEVFAGHTERTELELHRKYGPLVRTGPNEVTTNDPKAVELLYSISSKFPKTDFYRLFGFPDVYGIHQFSALDNALHNKLSRHTSAAFAMTSIVELEQYVDSSVEYFVTRIKELGTKGTPMNMAQWFQWYAFDVIGELTLSKRFGFMKYARDVDDSTKLIDTILLYTSVVGQAFTYHWLLLGNPLLKLFVSPPSGELINMTARELKERQGRSTDRRDLLSRFLKSQQKDPVGFSMDQLLRTCTMVIGAGSDTTGIALTGTLYHLLKNPEAYKRLKDEIDQAEKNGTLSRTAKLRETQPLPYLQAVIKEGMRVHPSVAFILPRHVPEGGCTIAGKFLPAGTRIGMNPYVLHRDQSIFGPDADLFRPERWFERDERLMNKYMLQFGQGSRICSGRHISILELNKTLVELIRNFDMELADPKFELTWTTMWFMKPSHLPVIFKPRHPQQGTY